MKTVKFCTTYIYKHSYTSQYESCLFEVVNLHVLNNNTHSKRCLMLTITVRAQWIYALKFGIIILIYAIKCIYHEYELKSNHVCLEDLIYSRLLSRND